MFLGSGRTSLRRVTRVISVNHRDVPAGLVVDEVQGFRRFSDGEFVEKWPQTAVRCDRYIEGAYERGQDLWPIFNFYDLLESNTFLQAAAE
jgi:twitching motility protein PilI